MINKRKSRIDAIHKNELVNMGVYKLGIRNVMARIQLLDVSVSKIKKNSRI